MHLVQRLGGQAVRAGRGDRHQHEQMTGQGPGGVRDLCQLRAVQGTVGYHTQYPSGWKHVADISRRAAQPPERAVAAVADAAHPAGDAAHPVAGRPDLDHVDGGDRRALGVGEDQDAAQRVVDVDAVEQLGGDVEGDRHRPRRAVGEPAGAGQADQVGAAEKAGQRGVDVGEQ